MSAALEAQVSAVMESLAKAAVVEICQLIDSQCVEMRLEIRRGQTEIQSLKGKLRDLKKALSNHSLAMVTPVLPHSHSERDTPVDDLHQAAGCEQEEEENSSELMNIQEDPNHPFLSCVNKPCQSVMSLPENEVPFRQPHCFSETLSTEGKADTRGLSASAIKVESVSPSVSTAECAFESCQADQKNTQDQVMGDGSDHFGTTEDFQPKRHYSTRSHHSEDASHCKYEGVFSHVNEQRNNEGNPSRVDFKSEPEEEPIAERVNELPSFTMTDSDALPWPFLTAVDFETQGSSSRLEQFLNPSHTDPQLFNLAETSEILPSCSIKHAAEPWPKQTKARKIPDRIQARTFKQNSASWSTMLTKVKNLPKTKRHKPIPCSFCPKSFYNASDLKRHQRIHTGEKPFGCAVCGKRFALRGNLITHERAHSGSKPFTCQQCGKSFAHGSNLTAHQRVHTGEKPFCCSLCGKTFAWHYPFKRHMNLHSQNGPIS